MIAPDQPLAAPGQASEICVPTGALAIDGVPPQPGDTVEYQGRGRVTRVEGDKAYLETTDVNGMPTHRQGDDGREEMMRAAEAADME
jgi:hypothetical protein